MDRFVGTKTFLFLYETFKSRNCGYSQTFQISFQSSATDERQGGESKGSEEAQIFFRIS